MSDKVLIFVCFFLSVKFSLSNSFQTRVLASQWGFTTPLCEKIIKINGRICSGSQCLLFPDQSRIYRMLPCQILPFFMTTGITYSNFVLILMSGYSVRQMPSIPHVLLISFVSFPLNGVTLKYLGFKKEIDLQIQSLFQVPRINCTSLRLKWGILRTPPLLPQFTLLNVEWHLTCFMFL